MIEFRKGDRVCAFGLQGTVVEVDNGDYPIHVKYDMGDLDDFTLDGRYAGHHLEPVLKLISRAKVKKKMYQVIYEEVDGSFCVGNGLYKTEEEAKKKWRKDFIALSSTPIEFEVEE